MGKLQAGMPCAISASQHRITPLYPHYKEGFNRMTGAKIVQDLMFAHKTKYEETALKKQLEK